MRRKVILYNPRCVFWTMPLALLAVGSALDPSRYEVVIVDGRLESDPALAVLRHVDDRTVAVGVTVLTGAPIRDALLVTRAVHGEHPSLPIVWGGWHPSLFPRLSTREVGEVLQQAVGRIVKHLRRGGLLAALDGAAQDGADARDPDGASEADGLSVLAESATSGRSPPAGPEWRRKSTPLSPLAASALHYDKPLCASLDGFTLHAATRAGALDKVGREALCKYVLRPPIAQERVTHGPDGLVRITLKKPFADGTVAVDMDPLSLLSRLAAAVPPPRRHTVRYAGILAPASKLRPKIVPRPEVAAEGAAEAEKPAKRAGSRYRPWAELLKRCFAIDVLACPRCGGRMRLVALVTEAASVRRFLRGLGESTDAPARAPARGPPYWRSRVLRRAAGEMSVA